MAIKRKKPVTPAQRGMASPDYSEITKTKPEKNLTYSYHRKKGRSRGQITTRHKGGGFKKRYREIDFRMNQLGEKLKILSIEYDPYRTAFIALARNEHGVKKYILANEGLQTGDEIQINERTPVRKGNRMRLENIPVGSFVFNIEMKPNRGGQIVRSAGSSAKVLAHDAGYTQLLMPSSEVRLVPSKALATIGSVSHSTHREEVVGKAGKSRLRGKRPQVRGSAMNPVDHPHGGGEGRAPVGLRKGPKTPQGKLAYGVKGRKSKKYSDKYIVRRRRKKKRK